MEEFAPISPFVWVALALRAAIFFFVVYLIFRRTLTMKKEIAERSFAARYEARTILRGIFSPRKGWEDAFETRDVEVLQKTRRYFVYVAALSLLVVFINQQTSKYIDGEIDKRSPSPSHQSPSSR